MPLYYKYIDNSLITVNMRKKRGKLLQQRKLGNYMDEKDCENFQQRIIAL